MGVEGFLILRVIEAPEGPCTATLRTQVPKTIRRMSLGTSLLNKGTVGATVNIDGSIEHIMDGRRALCRDCIKAYCLIGSMSFRFRLTGSTDTWKAK